MSEKLRTIYKPKAKLPPNEYLKKDIKSGKHSATVAQLTELFNRNQFKKISPDDIWLDITLDKTTDETKRALSLVINSARSYYGKFVEFSFIRTGTDSLNLTITDVDTRENLLTKTIIDVSGSRFPDCFKIGRYYCLYRHKILTILTPRGKANAWFFEKLN